MATVDAEAHAAPPSTASAPLWAVLALTFINSLGSGVVTTGFPFLTKSAYGFDEVGNAWLGVLQGVVYIIGALAVGPVLLRLPFSPRTVMAALMVILSVLCLLPWATGAGWAVWPLIAGYSMFTGVLWPVMESFLSGGRTARQLRFSIGLFNVTWSGSVVLAFWAMAPLLERSPLIAVLAMGGVHLVCLPLVLHWLPRTPGAHPHGVHAVPASYRRLLTVFRVQLPMSYLVLCALSPYLPTATKQLGLTIGQGALVASAWLIARVVSFAALQWWHGWHGRWATVYVGCAMLLAGFAASVLAPPLAERTSAAVGIATLVGGLLCFGAGMGVIYCSALYYAMEVGSAEVEAGGTHEALIGTGYMGGPLCLLAASWGVNALPASTASLNGLMVVIVSAIALALATWSIVRARRISASP